MSSSEPGTRVI